MAKRFQVSFDVTAAEHAIIKKIATRRLKATAAHGFPRKRLDVEMDVTACHANGNPLRLADLLAADDFNFGHDLYGIEQRLCRETGKLLHCFVPRFSAPAEELVP